MGWKTSAAITVASFFGVGSLVYLLLRKDEEIKDTWLCETSKVLELRVPVQSVGFLIGKGGKKIRDLEVMSDTKIKVVPDTLSEDFKIFVIRGTSGRVQLAERVINEILRYETSTVTFEMYIPATACGRLIGKCGDNIRFIQTVSEARLTLDKDTTTPEMQKRKLIIKGTPNQIAVAKNLVQQKLDEYIFIAKPEYSKPNKFLCEKYLLAAKNVQKEGNCYAQKTNLDDAVKVSLSAIASPDRFWLRIVGRESAELNDLINEMTVYYSKKNKRLIHKLNKLTLGQYVAVSDNGQWLRAQVSHIQINSFAEDFDIFLYHVDFGDAKMCKKEDVYELKDEFRHLRFQAFECTLANIRPKHFTWSEEAFNHLVSLKQCSSKHPFVARFIDHEERPSDIKNGATRVHCVELYQIFEFKLIDVAAALVEKGFAVWKNEIKEKGLKSSGLENPERD